MDAHIVEDTEVATSLYDDIADGITRWSYEEIWAKKGRLMKDYPSINTLDHYKWQQERTRMKETINTYYEGCKLTTRLMVHCLNGNGDTSDTVHSNEWRAIPEHEALSWFALQAAKKTMGPLQLAIKRAHGYSLADGFSPETKMMFTNIAALLKSTENVILKNAQAIDGIDNSTLKELKEWKKRSDGRYTRLLK